MSDGAGDTGHRGRGRAAVVILNYNGRDDTLDCIASLESSTWPDTLVVLVDNGSSDGVADEVANRHPDVVVCRNEENLGFPAGNNVGIRAALERGADFVFLVNNDTILAPDCIEVLIGALGRLPSPEGAIVSPVIHYADPPDLVWYAGADWSPVRPYNGRQTGYGERNRGQFDGVRETRRASGAGLLAPRAVWDEVGLLDEELFLQTEDVEWSLRARRHGCRIYVVGAARMWHRVSVASGGEHSPLIAYYSARNTLEVSRRYAVRGPVRRALHEWAVVAVHLAHARRAARPADNARAVLRGWRDARDGVLGKAHP